MKPLDGYASGDQETRPGEPTDVFLCLIWYRGETSPYVVTIVGPGLPLLLVQARVDLHLAPDGEACGELAEIHYRGSIVARKANGSPWFNSVQFPALLGALR